MWRKALVVGFFGAVLGGMVACGPDHAPERRGLARHSLSPGPEELGAGTVLILSSTVTGGQNSQEAEAARLLGYTVEVASPTEWAAKTASDFARYRALILGDPTCVVGTAPVQVAMDNRHVWGPVVNGNVIVVGSDPVYHQQGPGPVTANAVAFATAQENKTGAYICLSCYYHDVPAGTVVPLLDPFGAFTVTGVGCYDDAHIVATHPALSGLTDENLSNWSCSVHEAFDRFPLANFAPLVIARDPEGAARLPGSMNFADGSHGPPYMLARGVTPLLCGDSRIDPPEECDDGSLNGVPGQPCSPTCRLHWCGDGVVDPGEECDAGPANGSGSCSQACRRTTTSRPPVALCRNLRLEAGAACGATGSVDDGSYDPDGDLVGCTQSPAGPYGLGESHVVLTCTDQAGSSSNCVAEVEVVDTTPPVITLNGDPAPVVECGSSYVDPGATATDACFGDLTGAITTTGTVDVLQPGVYPLRYDVTDGAGLAAPTVIRSVRVADTRAPVITPRPTAPLWPPDHSPRSFRLSDCAAVVDPCGGALDLDRVGRITSITSDEPEDAPGGGDGHTRGDIAITAPSSFQLRSERANAGNGRMYEVRFAVRDASGNESLATCHFAVPPDWSGRPAVNDGPAAGYTVYSGSATSAPARP